MARIGGRSTWFAWLVGLACLGVVGVLAALAVPAVPSAMSWIQEVVHGPAPIPQVARDDAPRPQTGAPAAVGADLPADCEALYPPALYELLSTSTGVVARADPQPPDLADLSLASTLGAEPALTCAWDAASAGSIVTSVARVDAAAAEVVETELAPLGFECTTTGVAAHCERTSGSTVEVHDVSEGVWVVSVLDSWHPPGYAALVASQVWR